MISLCVFVCVCMCVCVCVCVCVCTFVCIYVPHSSFPPPTSVGLDSRPLSLSRPVSALGKEGQGLNPYVLVKKCG